MSFGIRQQSWSRIFSLWLNRGLTSALDFRIVRVMDTYFSAAVAARLIERCGVYTVQSLSGDTLPDGSARFGGQVYRDGVPLTVTGLMDATGEYQWQVRSDDEIFGGLS